MSNREQWPSAGRVVHYDPGNTECYPATVAGVGESGTTWEDGFVNLGNILDHSGRPLSTAPQRQGDEPGVGSALDVPLRAGPAGRTGEPSWHWPEYVGPAAAVDAAMGDPLPGAR